MSNIIPLNNVTKLDLPVNRILENAKNNLEGVIIVGYDNEGEQYFASSYPDGGTVLWLIEQCKLALLTISNED